MRTTRHVLFVLGLIVGIGAWFFDSPAPTSWVGRTLAPAYQRAVSGYRQLLNRAPLHRLDQGFEEFRELAASDAPPTTRARIAALRLEGAGIAAGGPEIYVESFDADDRKLHGASILYAESIMKQRFFETSVFWAKVKLSALGLLLSAGIYVTEVLERRRDQAQIGF